MADLHFSADRATTAERDAVDHALRVVEPVQHSESPRLIRGGRARRGAARQHLLPGLHALQHAAGWVSPGGLNYLCEVLQVPPAEAYGVATFYDLLRTDEPGHEQSVHHVCIDAACQMAGASGVVAELERSGLQVRRAACLGQCERAPARFVQGRQEADHVPPSPAGGDTFPDRIPQHGSGDLRLLSRVGVADPTSLESYRTHGGYVALARALDLGAERVLDEVDDAGLTGRGGAAFPTATKWRAVAGQSGEKHVVVNGDESEPGTFKDRIVMEHDPFAVVESVTIAGLVTGAENGWVYVRGEYPLAVERLSGAVDQARDAGFLGHDVAGSGRRFDIEIRRGAGAYICGEETALFNSIEGFRGEPRNKPPYPTTHGLFGRPTAVNNPETLLNVLDILRNGVDDYRRVGTEASPGHRLFCVSGHVAVPGVYEIPLGMPLAGLLDLAGGRVGTTRAVLLGGSAGAFVAPDRLDLPLSLEAARAAGLTLGSGAVTVFDDTVDMASVVTRIAEFFRHESCGQCVPCRVGTVRQHEVMVELGGGPALPADRLILLDDIGRAMSDASICGLGHTASHAVRSAADLGLLGRADDRG